MKTDHKEKIRKLLALAESPNEHEARAALLKARELMAEYKLTEAELQDAPPKNVVRILTSITCSKRRNPRIVGLSAAIGENYCCKSYRSHARGKQTQTIGFIGFEDDVDICVMIFKYAVDCVLSQIRLIKLENGWRYAEEIKRLCDSYGYGFEQGIQEAFKRQQEQNEEGWALVLVTPKEVTEAAQYLGNSKFVPRTAQNISRSYYSDGYKDGKEFDPKRRLAEA